MQVSIAARMEQAQQTLASLNTILSTYRRTGGTRDAVTCCDKTGWGSHATRGVCSVTAGLGPADTTQQL